MEIPRNKPCPCGSRKKYKRCCGKSTTQRTTTSRFKSPRGLEDAIRKSVAQHQANELIRTQQQGLGKPIITTKYQGHRVVAVGNVVHFSKTWVTFVDFLMDYIKLTFGKKYWEAEMAKSIDERHPLLQWYEKHHQFLKSHPPAPRKVYSATATGLVYCYLGVAYNLYLLSHNVELQKRFVDRLKRVDQFQGAYYELMVANSLIRAGFTLELEDETDQANKHCEFSAVSQTTKTKYWVEAKSRAVAGILGKTKEDGVSPSVKDSTTRLTIQINEALAKPASGSRLIFIDVNTDWSEIGTVPSWVKMTEKRLSAKEKNLPENKTAYVFVTNSPFHRDLSSTRTGMEILGYGLGISDFGKSGYYRYGQWYRMKQKHIDAHNVLAALVKYPSIPATFDGKLPSESLNEDTQRCIIGETYHFEDIGMVGTLLDATVMETERKIYYVVRSNNGQNHILTKTLTDNELTDYKAHPEAYFGRIKQSPKPIDNPFEFFEVLLTQHRQFPKFQLLQQMAEAPDFEHLKTLNDEDFLIEFCERLMVSIVPKEPAPKPVHG
jgi:hypothetical protein